MKLEQCQKDDLKSLTEHRGFKVLELIAKDLENTLFMSFKTVNLADAEQGKRLNAAQNKLLWVDELLNQARGQSQSAATKK